MLMFNQSYIIFQFFLSNLFSLNSFLSQLNSMRFNRALVYKKTPSLMFLYAVTCEVILYDELRHNVYAISNNFKYIFLFYGLFYF